MSAASSASSRTSTATPPVAEHRGRRVASTGTSHAPLTRGRMRMTRLRLSMLLLAAAATTTGCGYNQIQQLDEQVNQSQGQIETQIQRRADLIPNLVNTVKGYAQHEEAVFGQIAQARSALLNARNSGDPEQMANANAQFNSALGRLLVIAENYPQLKADQGFRSLQDQLEGTENRIEIGRASCRERV